mmetsp:Transcript_25054/g.49014  ORF Transcript_25054/g.49014 Transcript_25054/m.49014 type:complete len:301 (-) Transcript_25054:684-1586(-)
MTFFMSAISSLSIFPSTPAKKRVVLTTSSRSTSSNFWFRSPSNIFKTSSIIKASSVESLLSTPSKYPTTKFISCSSWSSNSEFSSGSCSCSSWSSKSAFSSGSCSFTLLSICLTSPAKYCSVRSKLSRSSFLSLPSPLWSKTFTASTMISNSCFSSNKSMTFFMSIRSVSSIFLSSPAKYCTIFNSNLRSSSSSTPLLSVSKSFMISVNMVLASSASRIPSSPFIRPTSSSRSFASHSPMSLFGPAKYRSVDSKTDLSVIRSASFLKILVIFNMRSNRGFVSLFSFPSNKSITSSMSLIS